MGLEAATYITQLNAAWPTGPSDPKSQGDDHLRLLKSVLQASFPNISGAVTLTHAQINDAAQKSAFNTFTHASGLAISNNAGGYLQLIDADGAVDNKRWRVLGTSATLTVAPETDAGAAGAAALSLTRSGNTTTTAALAATTVTLNGVNVTDYARLSQSNTFTGTAQAFQGSQGVSIANNAGGYLALVDSDAATDEKRWRILSNTGQLSLTTETDAGSGSQNAILLDRTGTGVDLVAVAGASITLTGLSTLSNGATSQVAAVNSNHANGPYITVSSSSVINTDVGTELAVFGSGANDAFAIATRAGRGALFLGTVGNRRFGIDTQGQIYGLAIHNNAGGATGTTNGYIASGTYTPTLTNTTNIAASTSAVCQWMRVGNVVTVSGVISIDPTAGAGTVSSLGISLPIASNFTNASQCGGSAVRAQATNIPYEAIKIIGDVTNDRAQLDWVAADAANLQTSFQFTYVVV